MQAGGAAHSRMASKSFTRLPFLEQIVDLPVLQITDELLKEADAAVRVSGGSGRGEAKVAAVEVLQVQFITLVQFWSRCSSLATAGATPIQR